MSDKNKSKNDKDKKNRSDSEPRGKDKDKDKHKDKKRRSDSASRDKDKDKDKKKRRSNSGSRDKEKGKNKGRRSGSGSRDKDKKKRRSNSGSRDKDKDKNKDTQKKRRSSSGSRDKRKDKDKAKKRSDSGSEDYKHKDKGQKDKKRRSSSGSRDKDKHKDKDRKRRSESSSESNDDHKKRRDNKEKSKEHEVFTVTGELQDASGTKQVEGSFKIQKKDIYITLAGETGEGSIKKVYASWKMKSGARYEGKCRGHDIDLPDVIEGTFEHSSGRGAFRFTLTHELENTYKTPDDNHAKKKEATKKKFDKNSHCGPKWEAVMASLKVDSILSRLGKKWTDPDFPPNDESIGNMRISGKKAQWKRADEFLKSPLLFQDGISPHDIAQGSLGDCYFLAALAALAEYPETVAKIFTCVDNSSGVYSLTFYPMGMKTEVLVDDYIPVYEGVPCFSRAHGPELWVMLLEKAYAKCYGCYKNISSGYPQQALFELTGASYLAHDIQAIHSDKLFESLSDADNSKYMMVAATPGTDSGNFLTASTGLCAGHAYTVLDAKKFESNKLLHIRNPWGTSEWTGAWGDKDSRWTPAAKRALDWVDADDGAYWMDIADFTKYFNRVTISFTHSSDCTATTGFMLESGKTLTIHLTTSQPSAKVSVAVCQGRIYDKEMVSVSYVITRDGRQYFKPDAYESTYNYCPGQITLGPAGSYDVVISGYPAQKKSHVAYLCATSKNSNVTVSGGKYSDYKFPK